MPVFICHSHQDKDFVDKLGAHLVRANAHVWVDRWELTVGDSLIDRIEGAIQDASAVIVVLSKASVQSGWVKKEINAGLIRELDEKRVVVLPLLLEDCDVPVFLKDKLYADFRKNFDKGLNDVVAAISKVTSDVRGRIEQPEWHFDWALDWTYEKEKVVLRLVAVEVHADRPHSFLTEIFIVPNEKANERYMKFRRENLEWVARHVIVEAVAECLKGKDQRIMLPDQMPHGTSFTCSDPKQYSYRVDVTVRVIGRDIGKDILFNYGQQVQQIRDAIQSASRKLTPDELKRVQQFMKDDPA